MSKKEVLERLYDRVMNDVFECSANYLMNLPKRGREREWSMHKETAEVLKTLLDDLAE